MWYVIKRKIDYKEAQGNFPATKLMWNLGKNQLKHLKSRRHLNYNLTFAYKCDQETFYSTEKYFN